MVKTPTKNAKPTIEEIAKASPNIHIVRPETIAQAEAKQGIPFEAPKPQIDINARLQKIKELSHLAERRDGLKALQEDLNKFKLTADKVGDCLTLTDTFGNSFKTTQTPIIADVLELIKNRLTKSIEETEILLIL